MRDRRLTFRALAELTRTLDPTGRGVTHAYLCGITSGHEHPSHRSLELIATGLDLDPYYFVEYRLAELWRELNEREGTGDEGGRCFQRAAADS
jgi:transcriptional regulator with XRE-family HTH domain